MILLAFLSSPLQAGGLASVAARALTSGKHGYDLGRVMSEGEDEPDDGGFDPAPLQNGMAYLARTPAREGRGAAYVGVGESGIMVVWPNGRSSVFTVLAQALRVVGEDGPTDLFLAPRALWRIDAQTLIPDTVEVFFAAERGAPRPIGVYDDRAYTEVSPGLWATAGNANPAIQFTEAALQQPALVVPEGDCADGLYDSLSEYEPTNTLRGDKPQVVVGAVAINELAPGSLSVAFDEPCVVAETGRAQAVVGAIVGAGTWGEALGEATPILIKGVDLSKGLLVGMGEDHTVAITIPGTGPDQEPGTDHSEAANATAMGAVCAGSAIGLMLLAGMFMVFRRKAPPQAEPQPVTEFRVPDEPPGPEAS